MFNAFYPREYVDSAYDIPYEEFYGRGIRGVIFDIDNTLVPHGAPADTRAVALFERLRGMGMETCLMSNNKEPRVTSFAAQVASRYLFKAGKPRIKGYKRAMELVARMDELGLRKEDYGFYLDLRKYGSTRHSGFGLGFERCVMYLTGVSNIRDIIPFPRTVNNCEL